MSLGRRRHIFAIVFGVSALAGAWSHQQAGPIAIATALDRYESGGYADAVTQAGAERLDVVSLLDEITRWVDRVPASGDRARRARRERVASAFVLDVVWTGTRTRPFHFPVSLDSPDVLGQPLDKRPWPPRLPDLGVVLPAVAWACQYMSKLDTVEPMDRWWWLTSVALLEDAGEWGTLLGTPKFPERRTLPGGAVTRRDITEGHLAHARARVPDEPRWQLGAVVARSQSLLGVWGSAVGPGGRGLYVDGRTDVLRLYEDAVRRLNTGPLNDLERELEALAAVPDVAADASLHAGYIRMLRRDWPAALAHFDRAGASTTEVFHRMVIDYFRGWTFERTNRIDEAIVSYRRAYAEAPRAHVVSSQLARLLFLTNQRSDAYEMLDAAWREDIPDIDPLVAFQTGDARLAAVFVPRMREALR